MRVVLLPLFALAALGASCPAPVGHATIAAPPAVVVAGIEPVTLPVAVMPAAVVVEPVEPTESDDAWGPLDDDPDAALEAESDPDAEAEPEADAPDAVTADAADEPSVGDGPPVLASTARESWIYADPSHKSRRIGYLRAGAVVARADEKVGRAGCKGGWYRIEPQGYVCVGKSATLDRFHPVVEASRTRPRMDGLPYDYVMSRTPTPARYARIPTEQEQLASEPDLAWHQRKMVGVAKNRDYVPLPEPGAMPPQLLYGQTLPGLGEDGPRDPARPFLGVARIRSGFALLSQFDQDGRRFGVTTDLEILPLDRTRWVKPTTFHGRALGDELSLPMGFVMKKRAVRYTPDEHGHMRAGDPLEYREPIALTGQTAQGGVYLETKSSTFVRADDVRRVDPISRPPTWATEGRRWIDVSILKQTLVAYDGTRPVYVTLVSTGADGLGDPKKTHSTMQGVFLVHTKHVTVTMDGDETGDPFDLRDVPFAQYFTEGYALHAAYWHDDFGTPRSHGCVNLAPADAAWLFGWTTPEVPAGWHAALSLKKGTLVYTHP